MRWSPRSVSSSTSHVSEPGNPATLSAPTARATWNRSLGTSPWTATCTFARRGGDVRAMATDLVGADEDQ